MDLLTNKIITRGIGSLTDTELLSLFLDDGNATLSAHEMAEKILAESGSLAALGRVEIPRLRMIEGVGLKRALRISAAAEFGRRFINSQADEIETINASDDVVRIFRPLLEGIKHEECWVLYLTNSNRIIERQCLSRGGVQGTVVDRRLVAKRALELLATQVVLIHNHPSGDARPSSEDKSLTMTINDALKMFDIRLLDHLIIAQGDSFSFRQSGLL